MFHWIRSSLPVRAGIAVTLIASLALVSAVSAGLIARFSEGDAAAINTAGSLRMTTYRLNWKLEAGADALVLRSEGADLERRLGSQALTQVLSDPQSEVNRAYADLLGRWENTLRPALLEGDAGRFQASSEDFVAHLNDFVLLLQKQSERKQTWQQLLQGTALFVTVIVLLVGLYQLQNGVLIPLQELVRTTERFRAGDLGARVKFHSEDELGLVAQSFNAMADVIEDSHRTLASRVAQKTAHLAQANAALALLCQSSRRVASSPPDAESLDRPIDSFQEHLPGLNLTLCLHGSPQKPAEHLIALHGSQLRQICAPQACASCDMRSHAHLVSCPVVHQEYEFGELRASFAGNRPAEDWETELIQALANLIGTALSLERQREQEHRLLLFEERAIIARELHDSLAQALSYMKLQISRLQTLIRRGESAETLESVSEEIREGLNNAYRQLRELLTTFRLQITEGGLDLALQSAAREFAERGQFQVELDARPLPFALSASEQIHLLQICREALSNCARHARAQHVWVRLAQLGEDVELQVEDDGQGLSGDFDQRQHHGLNIMRERARHLHGQLGIEPRASGGTRVHLLFRPGFLARSATSTVG